MSIKTAAICGYMSPKHGKSSECKRGNGFQIWKTVGNTLNKHSRTSDKRQSSSIGVGRGSKKNTTIKICHALKHFTRSWNCIYLLVQPKQWKKDMWSGTWNAGSLHKSGSLTTTTRELTMYKLYLGVVEKGRWNKGWTVRLGNYNFYYEKANENHQLETVVFLYQRIILAVKIVEYVSGWI